MINLWPGYRFLALALVSSLLISGCAGIGKKTVPTKTSDTVPAVQTIDTHGLPEVWRGPASKLAKRGFSQKQIESVFTSPNMEYSNAPMETKLRELYGIFYRSDLTREIQEKLYCLGYDLLIDGRGGSGTRNTIKRFQADNKLSQNGEISDATLAAINRVTRAKKGALRSLSSYSPPPAAKPSRTATHTQFTNTQALARITAHYKEDKAIFDRMSRKYRVPGEVAAAIMLVETGYGNYFGKHRAAANLASMAAAASDFSVIAPAVSDLDTDRQAHAFLTDYAVKRGDWALDELAALMTYSFDNGHDPTTFPGSIYGAIGWGQFMPSNLIKYGVDGNGDGRVDLFEKYDAIFSIGNFLKEHGWRGGSMTEEERRAVIMKYNKSGTYVNTVLFVADHLAKNVR